MNETRHGRYWPLLTIVLFTSSWSLFTWVFNAYYEMRSEYVYIESEARSDAELTHVSRRLFPYLTAILFLDQFAFWSFFAPSRAGALRIGKYFCDVLWLPSLLIHGLYWCLNSWFA